MKLLLLAAALSLASSHEAFANTDTATPLQLRPKAALAAASTSPAHYNAPFVTPLAEPPLDLVPHTSARNSPSACRVDSTLCYDTSDGGRIVYRPARNFMPDLPGFTRENLSVRRDRIVFRYSF